MNQKNEQTLQSCGFCVRKGFRRIRTKADQKLITKPNTDCAETAEMIPHRIDGSSAHSFGNSPPGHGNAAQKGRGRGEREFYTPAGPCPLDEQSLLFLKSRMQSGHCPAGNDENSSFALSPTHCGKALRAVGLEPMFRIGLNGRTPNAAVSPLTAGLLLRPRRRRARPDPGRHAAACAPHAALNANTRTHGRMIP